MAATPIPAHVIHTVFQYILPPALPIPPHLLSRPLIERHHFLSVSPSDAASYLCWPSARTTDVTEALEHGSHDALTSEPEHDVRYSAPDQETLLAHVRPHAMSPLQIVFAWDAGTESWRYHDARLLPFPDAAQPSLDAALTNRPKAVSGLDLFMGDAEEQSHGTGTPSPASDNYWAGYESSDSSPTTSAPVDIIAEEDDKAEAAYWASYSAVHGSGDSTMPSPIPEKQHFPHSQKHPNSRGPDIPTDPLITHLHLRLQGHNGLLSPRLQHDPPRSPNKTETQVDANSTMSITIDTQAQVEVEDYGFPRVSALKIVGPAVTDMVCTADVCSTALPATSDVTLTKGDASEDEGVKEAVRGIYRMWRAQTPSADAGVFFDIVKSALSGP